MNPSSYAPAISAALNIKEWQVANTLSLLEEGATIPFISRYRKERTGNLDETSITDIKEHKDKLAELDKRRATIIKTIREQEQLTEELEQKIGRASCRERVCHRV